MQLAFEAPGACRKAWEMSNMVKLPRQVEVLSLGTVFSGKVVKACGRLRNVP